jgi:hypothetical protein
MIIAECNTPATAGLAAPFDTLNTPPTPLVVTNVGVDTTANELFVTCASISMGVSTTQTTVNTYNNGATPTTTSNDGTSTFYHYNFAYGITTGNAVADSDSIAFATSNCNEVTLVTGSFKLPIAASFSQVIIV